MSDHTFVPPWWAANPHVQTLWGKLVRRPAPIRLRAERWTTPDDDFIDLRRLDAEQGRPRLIILHGLEGTSRSHYLGGILAEAYRRNWGADLLLFRSCGDEPNRTGRFYHSGETTDLAMVVGRVAREHPDSPLALVGYSLGGNVLLKWLGEQRDDLPAAIRSACAVSVPFDLARSAAHIDRGFARVYQAHFLRSLRRKALAKAALFPELVPRERIAGARTIRDFDDAVTAPIHGFLDAEDYYTRSSAIRWIGRIRVPTLLLSAVDDPFLPAAVLDEVRGIARTNPLLQIDFPVHGGHVGFVAGSLPWRPIYWAERRVGEFLSSTIHG
ncbi:MAG TPA: hydrolase [Gemmatimonadaceae bacterium]|nr:hydrolase [Gemmatimonadaceae bacterium]